MPAAKDAMDIVLLDAKDRAARIDDPETSNFIPANLAMIERKAIGEEPAPWSFPWAYACASAGRRAVPDVLGGAVDIVFGNP